MTWDWLVTVRHSLDHYAMLTYAEGRIHKASCAFDSVDFVKGCNIGRIQLQDLHILLYSGRCDRFCQHDMYLAHLIAKQHSSWTDVVLLRNLLHALFLEQWAACATQWTVCFNQDALLSAEVRDVFLRQIRIYNDLSRSSPRKSPASLLTILDLVHGRDHLAVRQ